MTKKDQYWSKHLAAITADQTTAKAYAEREGLSVASLYYWRRRLKGDVADREPARPPAARQLVPVRIAAPGRAGMVCSLALGPALHLELSQLPGPHWLASVATTFAGQ